MTRDEYEKRKQRLEDQLREGKELLEAAHRQQLRALEMIWMTTAEEDLPLTGPPRAASPAPAPPQPTVPARPARRAAWALQDDVEDALPKLPELFDRNDIRRALGYDPDRTSLFRILQLLVADGILAIHHRGAGKSPSVYRKTGAQLPAAEG